MFFSAAAAAIMLTACGGSKDGGSTESTESTENKEVAVTAISEAEGTLGAFVTLTDGTYTIAFTPDKYVNGKYNAEVSIPMTIKQLEGFGDGMIMYAPSYDLVLVDSNGAPLSQKLSMDDVNAFNNALKSAGDTKVTINFQKSWMEDTDVDAVVSKAKSVKLSVSGEPREMGGGNTVASLDESADVSASTSNSLFSTDDPDDMYGEYVDVAMELENLETAKEEGEDIDMDKVKELFAKADKMKPEIQKIKGKLNYGNQGALSTVNDMIARCKRTLK